MERNINSEVYLTLSKEGIESTKAKAIKDAEETYGKNTPEGKDTLNYEDVIWNIDEIYFDRDSESISANGKFSSYGKELGYLSHTIHISSEMLIEIIEHYMKKMGKLKTVMEALK